MHHRGVTDHAQSSRDARQPAKAKRAVVRIPAIAVIAVAVLAFGITPVAWTVPGMLVLYVIPAALLYWVLRVRTTATPDGLTARTLFGSRRMAWSELTGLLVTERGRVYAVTDSNARVLLPRVRSHNLPALSLISGGRLADPSGLTSSAGEPEPASDEPDTDEATVSTTSTAEQAAADGSESRLPEQHENHDAGRGRQ